MQPSQQRPSSWAQMSAAGSGRTSASKEDTARSSSVLSSKPNLTGSSGLTAFGSTGISKQSATLSSTSSSSGGSFGAQSDLPPTYLPSSRVGDRFAGSQANEPASSQQQDITAGSPAANPSSTALASDREQQLEEQQQEENRKLRLQLYVFVLRCISYSFNAKPTNANELHYKQQQLKLKKQQLEQIIFLHNRYLSQPGAFEPARCPHQQLKLAPDQLRRLDELYERAHLNFNRKYLANERMRLFVDYHCCSQQDLRELFRRCVEKTLKESRLFEEANLAVRQASSVTQAATSGVTQAAALQQQQQQSQQIDRDNGGKVGNYASLLASKDMLINSWLIKFESIILGGELEMATTADSPDAPATPTPIAGPTGVGPAAGSTAVQAVGAQQQAQQSNQLQHQQQLGMTKEQLYQMFQNILNIKKFEHQLLYNALQLDSADEQAAAIRRELDGRIARIAELERNRKLMPKFVLKEMDSLYLEETRMSVNKLMVNLDSLPVMKSSGTESRGVGYGLQKFRRYNNRFNLRQSNFTTTATGNVSHDNWTPQRGLRESFLGSKVDKEELKSKYPVSSFLLLNAQQPLWSLAYNSLSSVGKIAAQASLTRDGLVESHPSEPSLSKLDVVLTFNIEVIVMEVRGLRNLAPTREIYCTMEIEGSDRLQTEHVQAKKPLWDTQGDFTTNHPLPILKIKLYAVNQSVLSLEDKELGKLVLKPTVLSPKTPEWCTMVPSSGSGSGGSSALGGSAGSQCAGGGQISSVGIHAGQMGSTAPPSDQDLRIRVIVRMDRPQQLKHCGFLYGIGKSTWRKLKRRYHVLIQVSQYTFVMCAYREKKSKPTEMLPLDGYTVDYIEPPTDLIMEHCAEVTSNEHHAAGSSGGLGLAGRLANVILKSQASSSSLVGGSGGQLGATGSDSSSPDGSHLAGVGAGGQADQQQPSAIQTAAALSDELHSKYYFNVVKEGDSVVFACDDEQECFGWVMALYRATGQAHRPTPLRSQYSGSTTHYLDAAFAYQQSSTSPASVALPLAGSHGNQGIKSITSMLNGVKGGAKSSVDVADQRARKHGMNEFISADPCKFQHNQLFKYLQNESLKYRLNDQYCSLGWFSSGQIFVLDEYCARYGVRTCLRHLSYLNSLLDFNQHDNYFIDHTLLNYGYDFCSSHVSGNSGQAHPMGTVNFDLRPDGVGTVTVEERDLFHTIKSKLLKMIERQIANFSFCFPFGKPDGALKAALSLLERVLMKEQQTNSMVQNEEVRNLIRKCLEQAALNNYTKLSGQANLLTAADYGAPACTSAPAKSAGSTPAGSQTCSPIPALDAADQPEPGARLRTLSNLSSGGSSLASYAVSASSLGSATAASSGNNVGTTKRQLPAEPQQQQQQQQQQCLTMAMIINCEQIKPRDKLRYLTRLAELCCEQVEENNEYFGDAFAWHSDLMMDHFELFWSLFSVDMDKILGELAGSSSCIGVATAAAGPLPAHTLISQQQQQVHGSPSSLQAAASVSQASQQQSANSIAMANNRDVFALFQVLNDHMRKGSNLECRKFKAYLCDTFKPKLLRYIDISESTFTRMLFKACERDGSINCVMIEQMFARLDDLQRFVLNQLRWPEQQLGEQLSQRLKLIAYELCDACVQRALLAFQQLERKSNKWTASSTSYSSPVEMVQMINLMLETRSLSAELCTFNNSDKMSYHSKIDKLVESAMAEMQPGLMTKILSALESILTKLARFDEGNLLAPILSLTTKQGMSSSGRDIGKQYVTFVSNCCDLFRQKINDELWIVNLLEDWYEAQMSIICNWLSERLDHSLHDVQLVALTSIMPKIYADMSLQGVPEEKLNLKTYQTIMSRLKMEEAGGMAAGSLFEPPASTSIFNTSILSSLTSSSTVSSQSSASGAPTSAPGQVVASSSSSPASHLLSRQSSHLAASQQRPLDSPRRLAPDLLEPSQDQADNIADRALQSATRMFKGFWAG